MKMSRKERDQLASIIQQENAMLKRVKNVIRTLTILLVIFVILFIWGQNNITDPLMPNVSDSTRQVFKWVGLIGTIIFGIATGLSFPIATVVRAYWQKLIDTIKKTNPAMPVFLCICTSLPSVGIIKFGVEEYV